MKAKHFKLLSKIILQIIFCLYATAGCIKGNCINGQGTETVPGGNKYVGQFKDGVYHGHGTYTWANGGKYVGQFKDNKRTDQGTKTWAEKGDVGE